MNFDPADLQDLELAIADKLYIQVANWRLYLGDAGLANSLALECMARLEEGPESAAKKSLAVIEVSLAGGRTLVQLEELMPSGQVNDLIDLITPYCR